MKQHTLKELVHIAHTKPDQLQDLTKHYTAISELTGDNEYRDILEYLERKTSDRLSKEIDHTISLFSTFAHFSISFTEGSEEEQKMAVMEFDGKEFPLWAFYGNHIDELCYSEEASIFRQEISSFACAQLIESEAYQAMLKFIERKRLEFNLDEKEPEQKKKLCKV